MAAVLWLERWECVLDLVLSGRSSHDQDILRPRILAFPLILDHLARQGFFLPILGQIGFNRLCAAKRHMWCKQLFDLFTLGTRNVFLQLDYFAFLS